jgi:hypothetical protein
MSDAVPEMTGQNTGKELIPLKEGNNKNSQQTLHNLRMPIIF